MYQQWVPPGRAFRDERDFSDFVARATPELLRLAVCVTGNRHDAGDLTQEARPVMEAWKRIDQGDRDESSHVVIFDDEARPLTSIGVIELNGTWYVVSAGGCR